MKRSSNRATHSNWRDRFATLLRPVVFYQDRRTTVTTDFFESDGRRYPLEELDLLRRVELERWLHPRLFELWAHSQGRPIRLFRSRSAREFGQVCRALVRARERAGLA